MPGKYRIKTNEKLFDEWKVLGELAESFCQRGASAVQNNMEVTGDDIRKWLKDMKLFKEEFERSYFSLIKRTKEHISSSY